MEVEQKNVMNFSAVSIPFSIVAFNVINNVVSQGEKMCTIPCTIVPVLCRYRFTSLKKLAEEGLWLSAKVYILDVALPQEKCW